MNVTPKKIANLNCLENLKGSSTAIVLFHGYGASMSDLYGISQYLSADVDWYFPDGPIAVPLGFMMEGRAWFPIDMAELEAAMQSGSHRKFADKSSEDFDESQKLAIEVLKELRGKYDKLIVGGFSQGAMLASHVFSKVKADGLVLFSATLIDKNSLVEKLKDTPKIEFIQSHGHSDPLLSFEQAKDLFNLLEENGLKGEFIEFSGGHEIPENVLSGFIQYLEAIKQQ